MVKGATINGEVYLKTIQGLKEPLKSKRPSLRRQKNLLSLTIARFIKHASGCNSGMRFY
jgi:hypothetical protein